MSFAAAAALSGIASIGNTMLSQYYNKKNMRDQANLQYAYAQRYAQNSPSWNIQGLRSAGLNPILAVSNGVNLGANIPNITNSSPEAKIDIPAIEALKASKEVDIGQQNADSNSENSAANLMQGQAALMRADSQNKVDAANVALKTIEAEKLKGSKYDTGIMRDAEKVINTIIDSTRDLVSPSNFAPIDSYLKNSPVVPLPSETRTQYQVRKSREKQDSSPGSKSPSVDPYWKTRKTLDGSPVYRKRGDVGGVMHMYR